MSDESVPSNPPYAPPTYDAISVSDSGTHVSGDEITIGGGLALAELAPVSPRRRRRVLTFIASGLAVILMAGAVVVGAAVWIGWGATLPEDVLPGSSMGLARVDLKPGLGAALKLRGVVKKFPQTNASDPAAAGDITKDIVGDLGLEPLKYEDIAPWFGGRIGVAPWLRNASDKKGCTLTAISSSDDSEARAALDRVREYKSDGSFGFAFHKGYAITAECDDRTGSQSAAEAAIAEAAQQSLAANASFTRALDSLPSDQLVVIWADLAKFASFTAGQAGDIFGGGTGLGSGLTGDFVVGAQATDRGVEIRMRVLGGSAPGAAGTALAKLGALPGGTNLGVVADLHGTGEIASGLAGLFFLGLPLGGSIGSGDFEPDPNDPCMNIGPDSTDAEINQCTGGTIDPDCLRLGPDSTEAEIKKCAPDVSGTPDQFPTLDPTCQELPKDATPEDLQRCFGIDPNDPCLVAEPSGAPQPDDPCFGPGLGFENGLTALGKSVITAAIVTLGTQPILRLEAAAPTADDAKAIGDYFSISGDDLTVHVSGNTVSAASNGYTAGVGSIADNARYREVMAGAPDNSLVAFFADVEQLSASADVTAELRNRLQPLKAVGGSIGYDSSGTYGLIRLIIE